MAKASSVPRAVQRVAGEKIYAYPPKARALFSSGSVRDVRYLDVFFRAVLVFPRFKKCLLSSTLIFLPCVCFCFSPLQFPLFRPFFCTFPLFSSFRLANAAILFFGGGGREWGGARWCCDHTHNRFPGIISCPTIDQVKKQSIILSRQYRLLIVRATNGASRADNVPQTSTNDAPCSASTLARIPATPTEILISRAAVRTIISMYPE